MIVDFHLTAVQGEGDESLMTLQVVKTEGDLESTTPEYQLSPENAKLMRDVLTDVMRETVPGYVG